MSLSACGKCGNHHFTLSEVVPSGSSVKMFFIQCGSCGVPVGVADYFPNSTIIDRVEDLEKTVKSINGKIDTIDYNVRALAQRAR